MRVFPKHFLTTLVIAAAFGSSLGVVHIGSAQTGARPLDTLASLETLASSERASAANGDREYTLVELLRLGESNPDISAMQSDAAAMEAMAASEAAWMDPMVMAGLMNVPARSLSLSAEPMASVMIGASQTIPYPGKLTAIREAGERTADAMRLGAEAKQLEIARNIKHSYLEIYHLKRSLHTYDYHLGVIRELQSAATERVRLGKASQQEMLRLELQASDIRGEIAKISAMIRMEKAKLTGLTGVAISGVVIPAIDSIPDQELTIGDASAQPSRRSLEQSIAAEQAKRESARLAPYPDFTATLQYMMRKNGPAMDGTDNARPNMFTAMVGFSLPLNLGGKYDAQAEAADARIAATEARIRAYDQEQRGMIEERLAEMERVKTESELLHHEVYPLTNTIIETGTVNYRYGKETLQSLLEDQLMLLHRQHEEFRLQAEYYEAIADLEYLTGRALVDWGTLTILR